MRRISTLLLGLCLDLASASVVMAAPDAADLDVNLAAGKPVTASSSQPGFPPTFAVDADTTSTAWNSGNGGPSWIEIDLGADVSVASVVGKTAMSAGGSRTHSVIGRTSGGISFTLGTWTGSSVIDQLLRLPCSSLAPPVRYIRVQSQAPAGSIAWWDLRVYSGPVPVRANDTTWGRIKSLMH